MRVIERQYDAPPSAVMGNNSWFMAIERATAEDRLSRLVGDSCWDFVEDICIDVRAPATVIVSYDVPSVLPIRGSAL